MSYPNLKENPTLIKTSTKDDEIKIFYYKTQECGYENFLKTPINDKDYFFKKTNQNKLKEKL